MAYIHSPYSGGGIIKNQSSHVEGRAKTVRARAKTCQAERLLTAYGKRQLRMNNELQPQWCLGLVWGGCRGIKAIDACEGKKSQPTKERRSIYRSPIAIWKIDAVFFKACALRLVEESFKMCIHQIKKCNANGIKKISGRYFFLSVCMCRVYTCRKNQLL